VDSLGPVLCFAALVSAGQSSDSERAVAWSKLTSCLAGVDVFACIIYLICVHHIFVHVCANYLRVFDSVCLTSLESLYSIWVSQNWECFPI